ncbi:MAG: putative MFS-type transporter YcaD [Chlamydiae bacterium]|nr:putative MFS-type transporter YcaD [Chlamydiota bacterium]
MMSILKQLVAPIFSLVIVMLGNGFFTTFVSIHLLNVGYSNFIIGLIASSYFAGLLMGGFLAAKLIRQVGFIRSFATFASSLTALLMITSFVNNVPEWFLVRFLGGLCIAGLFVVIESWLLLFSNIKTRGKILAIYMTALYSAHAASQYLLDWMNLDTIAPFALVIILSAISIIPVSMMRAESPTHTENVYLNPIEVLKASPLGFVSAIVGGIVLSSFYSLGPVFATQVGFKMSQVAQFMAMTMFGGLLLQWPIGHLSDIFNRKNLMVFVSFTCAIIALGLGLSIYYPTWVTLTLCILFGGFSFTIYPLGITLACDRIDSKNIVAATGVLLIAYSGGSIIGPLIASQFMNLFGPIGLYVSCSLFCMLLSAYGSYRSKLKIDQGEQKDYVVVPRTTPVANELDPRSDEEGASNSQDSEEKSDEEAQSENKESKIIDASKPNGPFEAETG